MGNNEKLLWGALIIGGIFLFMNMDKADVSNDDNTGIDLCPLVDPTASFTGQRMFKIGTALTGQYVHVFEVNDGVDDRDLGQKSMNSGTLSLQANKNYNLYWGENESSTGYYTTVETGWTAPCQEGTIHKTGKLCQLDTNPTVTVYDENGQVQSTATPNQQAFGVDDVKNVKIKVSAASDKCYGNPSATGNNALCFLYNSTVFVSVDADAPSMQIPYGISSAYSAAGKAIKCFELSKSSDISEEFVTTTWTASATQPTSDHNVSIYLNDVAFDLDADSLQPIWGFEDEDNNELGAAVVTGDTFGVS